MRLWRLWLVRDLMHTIPQGILGKDHLRKWLVERLSLDQLRIIGRRLGRVPRMPGNVGLRWSTRRPHGQFSAPLAAPQAPPAEQGHQDASGCIRMHQDAYLSIYAFLKMHFRSI